VSKYILLSIKPRIVQEIIRGEKSFEFRKKFPNINDPALEIENKIIIYNSSPEKKIFGSFVAKSFYMENFDSMMSIVDASDEYRARIFRYIKHEGICFAMEISKIKIYKHPISLEELRTNYNNFGPGQSFRYLDKSSPIIMDLIKSNGSL
jgi:predicted transcriptional regulator